MSGDKNKNDLVLVYKRESKKDKAKDKDK